MTAPTDGGGAGTGPSGPAGTGPGRELERRFYSPREVADHIIDAPYKTVLQMIRDGQLRAIRCGRYYRIPREAIDELAAGPARHLRAIPNHRSA